MPTKLAFVRSIGYGDPFWGQTQTWGLAGYDPSISDYDVAEGSESLNMAHSIGGNVNDVGVQNPTSQVTTTRDARFSLFNSLPAARFFQGYFSPSFAWLAPGYNVVGHLQHGGLPQNWSPGAQGAAELHPATTYNPYPPGGALYPKAV
jgi:hypothetical protein